jgi:hypothetical protein
MSIGIAPSRGLGDVGWEGPPRAAWCASPARGVRHSPSPWRTLAIFRTSAAPLNGCEKAFPGKNCRSHSRKACGSPPEASGPAMDAATAFAESKPSTSLKWPTDAPTTFKPGARGSGSRSGFGGASGSPRRRSAPERGRARPRLTRLRSRDPRRHAGPPRPGDEPQPRQISIIVIWLPVGGFRLSRSLSAVMRPGWRGGELGLDERHLWAPVGAHGAPTCSALSALQPWRPPITAPLRCHFPVRNGPSPSCHAPGRTTPETRGTSWMLRDVRGDPGGILPSPRAPSPRDHEGRLTPMWDLSVPLHANSADPLPVSPVLS